MPRLCVPVDRGVDASRSTPAWIAERLRRGGIRPVSLLVDITQYVMLELGQPMHAFDRDLLKGPVGVRRARGGESVKLLDGRDVALDDDFVVITDAGRVVGLAGVMGGFDTRVTDATRNVFLEAAHFAPAAIIGRGRKLGLHTDAGHRFERGVDPQLPRHAIESATRLIVEIAGGAPGPVVEAVLPQPFHSSVDRAVRRVARCGRAIADAESTASCIAGWPQAIALRLVVTRPASFDLAIERPCQEIARITL